MTRDDLAEVRERRRKNAKAAGTKRELQEVRHWQEKGYVAFRTPASMGVCDVIAMRLSTWAYDVRRTLAELYFVEVKANTGSPFKSFLPLHRRALIASAQIAGATPLLVHHPPHGERREIRAEDWPAA